MVRLSCGRDALARSGVREREMCREGEGEGKPEREGHGVSGRKGMTGSSVELSASTPPSPPPPNPRLTAPCLGNSVAGRARG